MKQSEHCKIVPSWSCSWVVSPWPLAGLKDWECLEDCTLWWAHSKVSPLFFLLRKTGQRKSPSIMYLSKSHWLEGYQQSYHTNGAQTFYNEWLPPSAPKVLLGHASCALFCFFPVFIQEHILWKFEWYKTRTHIFRPKTFSRLVGMCLIRALASPATRILAGDV